MSSRLREVLCPRSSLIPGKAEPIAGTENRLNDPRRSRIGSILRRRFLTCESTVRS